MIVLIAVHLVVVSVQLVIRDDELVRMGVVIVGRHVEDVFALHARGGNRDVAAVGCATGDQIVLDLHTHHLTRIPVTSVDIVAADDHFLFFASYGSDTQAPQLAVTTLQGQLLQTIPLTAVSHTVTVDKSNGHVYVPLDGGQVEIFQKTC